MKKIFLLTLICSLFFVGGTYAQTTQSSAVKLRIGTYNIGHFNCGKLGGYKGTDVKPQLKKWKKWIKQQKLAIFSVNEWNYYFDKDSTIKATDKLLKPIYKHVNFGPHNTWIYNGIATNFKVENVRSVTWALKDYYAVIADVKIGDKKVTVMSTHIPWQKQYHDAAVDQLIKEMKKYDYLICMGDMNSGDSVQLRFAKEGFNIANGGSQGFLRTIASKRTNDISIDNIITTKNISISNVSAPVTGLSDNDHNPIEADIEIH